MRRSATIATLSFGIFVTVVSPAGAAADRAGDEAAIRGLIAQLDAGKQVPRTAKRVFWSGAFERPVLDGETAIPRKDDAGIENRVPDSQRSQTTVRRVVVSDAGDMAYEYSAASLSFDLKSGKHVSFTNSSLRVWQKESGQWKLAASFSFPHQRD